MKKFLEAVENPIWHRQLLYGLILAIFFGGTTLLSGFHPVWVLIQIAIIAGVKEHYVQDLIGKFHWRNFFLLQLPAFLLYIIITF